MLPRGLLLRRPYHHLPIPEARRRVSRGSSGIFFPFALVAPPYTTPTRRTEVMQVPRAENSVPKDKKVANISANHKQTIKLPDYTNGDGRFLSISEFLCHPSGVESILNTRALQSFEPLDPNTYRCTLPTIQFLKFEVVPVMDLRVTSTSEGCTVEMLTCKFGGSEALEEQNHRFSASMKNHITWGVDDPDPCLNFDVNLGVTLEVYRKPFSLLPVSAVEIPGNLIMQGLIDRLVPLLIHQLLEDYQVWVEEKLKVSSYSSTP